MKALKCSIIALAICILALPTMAQNKKNCDKEKIKCEKVDKTQLHKKMMEQKYKYFQKELQLDDKQMDTFWDIYEKYDKDIFACHEEMNNKTKSILDIKEFDCEHFDPMKIDEKQAKQILQTNNEMEHKILEIKDKYSNEFANVLKPQQLLKLKKLEKRFMREIMRKGRCESSIGDKKDKQCQMHNQKDINKK